MITKLIWPKCRLMNDNNAFWVGCTDDEVATHIVPRLNGNRVEMINAIKFNRGASEIDKDEVNKIYCNFFLISTDATDIRSDHWIMPHSVLWNGNNPFVMIGKHSIMCLTELKGLEELLKNRLELNIP